MVCFSNIDEMKDFLGRAGIELVMPSTERHYIIIGKYSGLNLGCTSDRISVLFEEEEATFQEVKESECPIHNEE